MDKASFQALADSKGIRRDAYSIGRRADEAYVAESGLLGWSVFYYERGVKTQKRRFRTETDALRDLMGRLEKDPSTKNQSKTEG